MKNVLQLRALLLLAIGVLFFTSCEDEPGPGTGDLGPTITLNSDAAITLAPGEEFTIDFSANDRDALLKAITVYEDGITLPTSRLKVNGVDAASNPVGIVADADKEGINWTVTIVAQSTAASMANFEVEVQDDNDEKAAITVAVTTVADPPVLTTSSPTMGGMADQDAKYTLRISGAKGGGKLSSIEVRENEMLVDPSRIFWKVITSSVATNPFLLEGDDQDGFDQQELIVMTPMSEGTFTYKVTLTDEFNSTSELSFDITTLPGVTIREDVILNLDGEDDGGLDLDTGNNVPSDSTAAELIDNGIDINLPASQNWIQTISPVNGTTMKYVVPAAEGVPESFTFDGVSTKAEVAGAFTGNTATLIDEASSTSRVEVGDMFAVTNNGNYWLLIVKEVDVREEDNTDRYVFDVKF